MIARGLGPFFLGLLVALALSSASARTASATVDMTGRWLVKTQGGVWIYHDDRTYLWDFVQTGTTVTRNGWSAGSIDLATDIAYFPPNLQPIPICSDDSGITLQVAPDGQTFTGGGSFHTYIFNDDHIDCLYDSVTFFGSRCGGGTVDPGEQCDDGNTNDSDGCKNDCTLNVCGDGIVHTGVEDCDDGNVVSGDGCSATCQREFIPGGGSRHTDCGHEWMTSPVPAKGLNGLPRNRLECIDDDPACDFGAAAGDHACTFHVAMCLDVTDVALGCAPVGTAQVQLLQPGLRSRNAVDAVNRSTLESALVGIGGHVQGVCSNIGGATGQFCQTDQECDTAVGAADGLCHRLVAFDPSSPPSSQCTSFADITVPLGGHASARTKLRLSAASAPSATGGRFRDVDALTLVCKTVP